MLTPRFVPAVILTEVSTLITKGNLTTPNTNPTIPPTNPIAFLYIRFIGDRTIQEKDFGKIQKDRISEMKKWARFLKSAREEKREKINLAIVATNNHYADFGPGTANTFRKMLDLSEVTWNDVKMSQAKGEVLSSNTKQTTLSDFLK